MLTKTSLSSSTPEAQGIATASILAFLDAVEQAKIELHSFILVRHGQVVTRGWWSPYAAEYPHLLFSLSKSFTSTAVGMAVAEGLLTVDDRVVDFFPEDLPDQIDDNLAAMTVHNLLSMNTGHDKDATGGLRARADGHWVKAFLSLPVEHKPGSHFVYNSAATYMCSAIVQKLTGKTLLDYLTPRLFEPLGIAGATWQSCPRGINVGGWGLRIKSDDIANFGQLYLQQGRWQGQQLVSPEWVAAATSKQVDNDGAGRINENPDWIQGYGYQFWRCRYNAYRGDGAFGQFCVVMPDQDAHIAITSGVTNMQEVLDLVWKHLLPAMKDGPLPADPKAQKALTERVNSLSLRMPSGAPSSSISARVSGQSYQFEQSEQNEDGIDTIRFDFKPDGALFTVQRRGSEHQLKVGAQRWEPNVSRMWLDAEDIDPEPVAVSGAWTADDTYTIRIAYTEMPFIPTLTFHFANNTMEFTLEHNVAFGPPESRKRPALVGKKL